MFILRTLIECLILRIDSYSVACAADMLGVLLTKHAWLKVGKCAMRRGFSITETRYTPALKLWKRLMDFSIGRGRGASAGREKPG